MALSFRDWKTDLIRKIVLSEVNSFLHLYIKAQNWNDIIKIMKKAGFEEWNFNQNVISFQMLDDIPAKELESENVFNRNVDVLDLDTTIWLLNNANCTISQTGVSKGKVFMFGQAVLNANLQDSAMLDIEQLHDSTATIGLYQNSFLISQMKRNANANIKANDDSVVKCVTTRNALLVIQIRDNSLLNLKAYEESVVSVSGSFNNIKIYQRDKAIINQLLT